MPTLLEKFLKDHDWSYAYAGRLLKVDPSLVRDWALGLVQPRRKNALKILKVTGVPVTEFGYIMDINGHIGKKHECHHTNLPEGWGKVEMNSQVEEWGKTFEALARKG